MILDVSPAGLSIETVKWMKPGEWIFVNTSLGDKKLGIPGEVKWVRQVASTRIGHNLTPVYHVGISVFRDDVQREWEDLVEECASGWSNATEVERPDVDPSPESSTAWGVTSLGSPTE